MNRWPLREALEHFYLIARERALEQWRHEELVWALLSPWLPADSEAKAPERPEILG